jgi:hypothetical protein
LGEDGSEEVREGFCEEASQCWEAGAEDAGVGFHGGPDCCEGILPGDVFSEGLFDYVEGLQTED